jgi:hypothetical protein
MSVTQINGTQTAFIHDFLRGKNRSLSAPQARALFGIKNLRSVVSELRQLGLVVRTAKNTVGNTTYSISARDVNGSKASLVTNS